MPQRLFFAALLGMALGAFLPGQAEAQRAVILEPRLGVTLPLGDLAGDRAEAGVIMGVEARMVLKDRVHAYTGMNRHTFRCPQSCAELGNNPRSTGFAAGLVLTFPTYQEAVWWTRVGAVSHRFSSDLIPGDMNLGLEVGGGVDIPVNERLGISPTAGFISHGLAQGITARYLTFGIGLHYRVR